MKTTGKERKEAPFIFPWAIRGHFPTLFALINRPVDKRNVSQMYCYLQSNPFVCFPLCLFCSVPWTLRRAILPSCIPLQHFSLVSFVTYFVDRICVFFKRVKCHGDGPKAGHSTFPLCVSAEFLSRPRVCFPFPYCIKKGSNGFWDMQAPQGRRWGSDTQRPPHYAPLP